MTISKESRNGSERNLDRCTCQSHFPPSLRASFSTTFQTIFLPLLFLQLKTISNEHETKWLSVSHLSLKESESTMFLKMHELLRAIAHKKQRTNHSFPHKILKLSILKGSSTPFDQLQSHQKTDIYQSFIPICYFNLRQTSRPELTVKS